MSQEHFSTAKVPHYSTLFRRIGYQQPGPPPLREVPTPAGNPPSPGTTHRARTTCVPGEARPPRHLRSPAGPPATPRRPTSPTVNPAPAVHPPPSGIPRANQEHAPIRSTNNRPPPTRQIPVRRKTGPAPAREHPSEGLRITQRGLPAPRESPRPPETLRPPKNGSQCISSRPARRRQNPGTPTRADQDHSRQLHRSPKNTSPRRPVTPGATRHPRRTARPVVTGRSHGPPCSRPSRPTP